MKGFPRHKGAKGLPKKTHLKLDASDPAYERFAQRVANDEIEWSDHPDYNPNWEYDQFGNPITDVKSPKTTDLGTSDHVFGSIDTSVTSGDKGRQVEEEPTQKEIDKAISKYRKAEQLHGAGNVSRGDMTDADFDILLNYGGSENYGGSWIQERMINSAKGHVDSEPHLQGKYSDMQMYPNLKEGETPKLRKVQKNFANMYQDIMNDPANADFVPGYSDSADIMDKKTAKNLAKELIPDLGLTSTPTSLRPGEQDNLTDEQEDAEVIEVEEEIKNLDGDNEDGEGEDGGEMVDKNKDGISDYAQSPDYVDPAEKVQEVTVKEDEKKFDPKDYNKDGVVDYLDKRMGPPDEEGKDVIVNNSDDNNNIDNDDIDSDEESASSDLEGDYNKDGVVDYMDKRFAPMTKKPVFGTDEYYDFMKKKRTKEMGLTKRMFNIYDKD